jgi:hypothetical protein
MAGYEAWNRAIAEFFFDGSHAYRPVYLQIDRETLADIGPKAGVTPGDEEQSFTEAVRAKLILPGRIDPFRLFQGMVRAWKARLQQNPLDPPPFLGLLGICVLAASRMASDPESGRRSTNYYVPLNGLLGLDNTGEPPGFRWVTSLWERLNSWLEETNGGALGLPTAVKHEAFPNVGYPISQCLFRDADRAMLPDFYSWAGFFPGEDASGGELIPLLKAWAGRSTCPLGRRPRNLLTEGSDLLVQQAAEVVAAELKAWDGAVKEAEGQSRAGINLRLEMYRGGREFLCELYPRAPGGFPEGEYQYGDKKIELERLPGTGWFAPLPESLVEDLYAGIRLRTGTHTLSFAPAGIIPMSAHTELGGWVSCDRVDLGARHLVLCHSSRKAEVEDYLEEYAESVWEQTPGSSGLPPSWVCIRGVQVNTLPAGSFGDLDCLVPRPRVRIRLVGGLKLVDRDSWLKGGEPVALVSMPEGQPVTVYIDGQEAGTYPEGSGQTDLAGRSLSAGEHVITAGSQGRSFYLRESANGNPARAPIGLIGHAIRRNGNSFTPLSPGAAPVSDVDGQSTSELTIVGASVLGPPQNIPAPLQDALVLSKGYRRYVLLGRCPGEIMDYRPHYELPFQTLKDAGRLEGKFQLPVPFEPQWLITLGAHRTALLWPIGAPQPPETKVADEGQVANWIRWAGKSYRIAKDRRCAGVWKEYQKAARRQGGTKQ